MQYQKIRGEYLEDKKLVLKKLSHWQSFVIEQTHRGLAYHYLVCSAMANRVPCVSLLNGRHGIFLVPWTKNIWGHARTVSARLVLFVDLSALSSPYHHDCWWHGNARVTNPIQLHKMQEVCFGLCIIVPMPKLKHQVFGLYLSIILHLITHPCLNRSYSMLVRGAPDVLSPSISRALTSVLDMIWLLWQTGLWTVWTIH